MATKYGPTIVTDGLVFYVDAANSQSYPGSGNYWIDLSGNGLSLTLQNSPSFSTNNGGYFDLDGQNDHFNRVGDLTPIVTDRGSWSFWAKAISGSYISLLHIVDSNYTDFQRIIGDSTWTGYLSTAAENDNSAIYTAFSTGDSVGTDWFNVVLRQNGTNIQFYINGTSSGTAVVDTSWISEAVGTTTTLRVGRAAWGDSYWYGQISVVQYYNRGLTDAEILQNYNAHKGRYGL